MRLAQRLAGPGGEVGQRLTTQRLLGLGDPFAGDGLDQRLVQRGKKRACAPVLGVRHGKVPGGPPFAPTPDLTPRKAHALAGFFMGHVRLLVEQQGKLVPLDGLMRSGLASDLAAGFP